MIYVEVSIYTGMATIAPINIDVLSLSLAILLLLRYSIAAPDEKHGDPHKIIFFALSTSRCLHCGEDLALICTTVATTASSNFSPMTILKHSLFSCLCLHVEPEVYTPTCSHFSCSLNPSKFPSSPPTEPMQLSLINDLP